MKICFYGENISVTPLDGDLDINATMSDAFFCAMIVVFLCPPPSSVAGFFDHRASATIRTATARTNTMPYAFS